MHVHSTLHRLLFIIAMALPYGWAMADANALFIPSAKELAHPENKCVEPAAEMRKNHMNYILHQRDDTVRLGVRTDKHKGHSLKECINCHNAPGKDGKVARFNEREHFCNACHSYTAVKVDCFDCHIDKPANTQYRHASHTQKIPQHNRYDSVQLMNQQPVNSPAVQEGKQP